MTPEQAIRARKLLKWSLEQAGSAAKVGSGFVASFEAGRPISPWAQQAIERAYCAQHIRFVDTGWLAGGLIRSRLWYRDTAYRPRSVEGTK
jgi:hypothetical protein